MRNGVGSWWAGIARAAGLAAAFAIAGCGGGGGGGGGTEPQPCSITNVSTGTVSSWLVGLDGPANLRWDHTGSATAVKIELLKGGAVVSVVAASTANDGFFAWTPSTGGQANGSDFGLRVTALGEAGCAGERNGLTLTDVSNCTLAWSSADPDTINAGESLALAWDAQSTSGTVDIELWQDDLGGEPQLVGVIAAGTPDDGAFTWDPVDSFHFGTNDWFTLRLSDPLVAGCGDETPPFRMVDEELCSILVFGFPGGSTFTEGSTMHIETGQTFGSGFVDLRLVAGAELVAGGTIATDVPVGQVYDWVVDDFGFADNLRSRFRIRAIDSSDGYCWGQSDVFTIPQ